MTSERVTNFIIPMPEPIKVGDYIRTTPTFSNGTGTAFIGRVIGIQLDEHCGRLIFFTLDGKDKDYLCEHAVTKVTQAELREIRKLGKVQLPYMIHMEREISEWEFDDESE